MLDVARSVAETIASSSPVAAMMRLLPASFGRSAAISLRVCMIVELISCSSCRRMVMWACSVPSEIAVRCSSNSCLRSWRIAMIETA